MNCRRVFSSAFLLELDARWEAVVTGGSVGPLAQADLDLVSGLDVQAFAPAVLGLRARLGEFLHEVVIQRRDASISSWRT